MHWTALPPGALDPLRRAIHAEIEKRTGRGLSVSDSLPDELIAEVQALQPEGCSLNSLLLWIYTHHPEGMTAPEFRLWFRSIESCKAHMRELARRGAA